MTMDKMIAADTGNHAVRYKGIVVAIHWISALLIVSQIVIGLKFADMPKGPVRMDLFSWHKIVGVTILLLAVIRLVVRLINPPPPFPADFPKWERASAVWTHRIFYFLMFAMPITGLSLVSDHAKNGMVDLRWGLQVPAFSIGPVAEVHSALAWGWIALLVLHVGAALKQQFFDKTAVADRMPPFRSPHHNEVEVQG
jgi:cytochrome b561